MQSTNTLYGVSFKKNPRIGQDRVFKRVYEDQSLKKLNIKLPTGYGKTITAVGTYAILKNQGRANRLMMVFPTKSQLEQFKQDGPGDLESVGILEKNEVIDIGWWGVGALKKHRNNEAQIFAITIQSLITNAKGSIAAELLNSGRWMICVDEYHHYGVEATWGKKILELNYDFLLAMSATPNRPGDDSAFGEPEVKMTYKEAVDEKAVKPLIGHSYNYKLDAIDSEGEIFSFTTDELISEVGSENPDTIEKFLLTRDMRISPKYISPLVSIPIERMLRERIATGYKLQALVGCMFISHAVQVAKQIAEIFPELSVDWVGTGENGKSAEENKKIINQFCPPKDANGKRNPTLDVLVHVGIAGEGLDTLNVSETIKLHRGSINNKNKQDDGRNARYLEGVTGHVNFDSSTDYAQKGYIGKQIMNLMDDIEPDENNDEEFNGDRDPSIHQIQELPDEPKIQLYDLSLMSIDSGDLNMTLRVARELNITGISYQDLDENYDHPEWEKIRNIFRTMHSREAESQNEQAIITKWSESVQEALTVVTSRVIQRLTLEGSSVEKSLRGDIRKRINSRKKYTCGAITRDVDVCKKHYQYLKNLEVEIIEKGVPSWLQ